ncbi:unnamed protein product [Ascophyllum nodosum]
MAQAGLREKFDELEARLHVAIEERDRLASRIVEDDETPKLAARVFAGNMASFSEKEKLYARDMELKRCRIGELERELADATAGRKEEAHYASQVKEALDRRSSEVRGVRGLLAAANKRCEELEAKLRPRRQQEGAQGADPAYSNTPDTDVNERIRAVGETQ